MRYSSSGALDRAAGGGPRRLRTGLRRDRPRRRCGPWPPPRRNLVRSRPCCTWWASRRVWRMAPTILAVNLLGAALVAVTGSLDLAVAGSVAVFIASLAGHTDRRTTLRGHRRAGRPSGAGSPRPGRAGIGRWSHGGIGLLTVEARGDPDVPPSRSSVGPPGGTDPVGVAWSDQQPSGRQRLRRSP